MLMTFLQKHRFVKHILPNICMNNASKYGFISFYTAWSSLTNQPNDIQTEFIDIFMEYIQKPPTISTFKNNAKITPQYIAFLKNS